MSSKKKKIKIPSLLQPHFHHLGPQHLPRECLLPELSLEPGHLCMATPCACEPTAGPFLHNVGMKGQLAFLQPSAVSLGNLEEISDVQQSLADVRPKALGILWEPRAQTNCSGEPLSLCPYNQGLFPSQTGPQVAPPP